ncbi:hypothetical protein [Legionella drancourtii]|uniref:Ankyrin repeat protein n=1 Tax=Legionella drancourtii LLAP12 TaxID=658187 RepID=G9EKE3_9GAMM|nr:hypothetical protein [Legionella drancourtii]EHL32294.1 hypothetical protein LDG_5671 [Legionella drancourtii LLAP12]
MSSSSSSSERQWKDIIGFPTRFPAAGSFDDFQKKFFDALKEMPPKECPWEFIFIMPGGGDKSDIMFGCDGRFPVQYGEDHLKPNADKPYLFLWVATDKNAQWRLCEHRGYVNLVAENMMREHKKSNLASNFMAEANRGNVYYHTMSYTNYSKRWVPTAVIMKRAHADIKRYGTGFEYEEAQDHFYACLITMEEEATKLEKRGYKQAADKGKELCEGLHKAAKQYFKISHPSSEDFKTFERACNQEIANAKPTLDKHWEWSQLLATVGIIISTLGLGLAYAVHRKAGGGNFLFFKSDLTQSFDRVMEAKKQVDEVDKVAINKGFK